MKQLSLLIIGLSILLSCNPVKETDTHEAKAPDFKIEFGELAKSSVLASDTMTIWGGSLVKGEDGLYHLFYSRWPKHLGWVWVSHSEIAHAVSDSPYGPFQFKDVALPDRGEGFWDGKCTHNPTIHKFGGKYYLYYMGNTGDKKVMGVPGKEKLNWVHRNNQRIGVAVADNPNGPWERFDQPLIDVSSDTLAHDALMTSNPSVCQMTDGKILMVYKAVGKKFPLPGGGPVVHLVAIADSPIGPFKKYPNPVFTFKGERFPAEDPYIWHEAGKYRAIVKRMKSGNEGFSLVHYNSEDGINWEQAKHFKISENTIVWEDGRKQQFTHLERPQVLVEDGKAKMLLCAADTLDANNVRQAFNVQIPLNVEYE